MAPPKEARLPPRRRRRTHAGPMDAAFLESFPSWFTVDVNVGKDQTIHILMVDTYTMKF